ncbi:zinc-finger homeodomain protein 1-like [Diospyros lotus]|uniref:zinc-finger homeodomain protein 1-like n=1 Tax=Diospyros lotus TaxID=55363 RepID=UPI002257558F|nr:zinc-finger homeodomain protein 1-like [Diospyros lotus]
MEEKSDIRAAGTEGALETLKGVACQHHCKLHKKQTRVITNNEHINIPTDSDQHRLPPHLQFVALYGPPPGFKSPLGLQKAPEGEERERGEGSHNFQMRVAIGCSITSTDSENAAEVPIKRPRTRFSKEQKERMLGLAEKVGWKVRKENREAIRQVCDEIGVLPLNFKIWVRNNKKKFCKKE